MNLKIIKASIGCEVQTPRQGGKGKGKGKDKGKDKAKPEVRRGIGTGEEKLKDEDFATVTITADTAHKARGGKRCIEVMLGYAKDVNNALAALGVEVVMPSLDEMTDGKASSAQRATKDGIDPMDPASYSDAPVGGWSAGMKKPGQSNAGGNAGGKSSGGKGKGGRAPPKKDNGVSSKEENAE